MTVSCITFSDQLEDRIASVGGLVANHTFYGTTLLSLHKSHLVIINDKKEFKELILLNY